MKMKPFLQDSDIFGMTWSFRWNSLFYFLISNFKQNVTDIIISDGLLNEQYNQKYTTTLFPFHLIAW